MCGVRAVWRGLAWELSMVALLLLTSPVTRAPRYKEDGGNEQW